MNKNSILLSAVFISAFTCEACAVNWEHDLTAALQKSKSENKTVMADFYTDWCGWCKKLDKDVYEDAGVNRLAGKFICVKVDCTQDRVAASKYGIKGYPTVIFFNSDGKTAETIVGYKTAQEFTDIMNKLINRMARSAEPANISGTIQAPEKKRAEGEYRLTGIMGRKAIVNDSMVSAGGAVDGATVIAVGKKSVTLRRDNKELILTMD